MSSFEHGTCALLVGWLALGACTSNGNSSPDLPVSHGKGPAPFDPGQAYAPSVQPADLIAAISNPLFPAPVGARWVYESHTDEGVERIETEVLPDIKDVWGTSVRVVRDTGYLNGALVEDTRDYYAQDHSGNVWYMGEQTAEYANGKVTSEEGSWESGVATALPGVQMLATPQVGDVYRQEYLSGQAEDLGEVASVDESVTVPAGSWDHCVSTRDRSALESALETKYYCKGIGLVLEVEGKSRVELIEVSGL